MLNKLLLALAIITQMCLSVFAQTHEWHLTWDKNPEDDMSNYKIFRSTSSPAYTEYGTVQHPTGSEGTVTFQDTQLNRGTQYYYRIKAVNNTGGESDYSDQVSAAIPDASDLPASISLADGASTNLQLNEYVYDPDHSDGSLTWEVSGGSQLQVNINSVNQVATITAPNPWTSQEVLTFTVTDPDSFYDQRSITVFAGLSTPEITISAPLNFNEDGSLQLNLNDHVDDSDTPLQNLYWQGGSDAHLSVSINQSAKTATIQSEENWNGSSSIWLKVMDTDFQTDSLEIQVVVNPVNDAPVISNLPNLDLSQDKTQQISLNNYVDDVDNNNADLNWSVSGNSDVTVGIGTGNIAQISASTEWAGQESITFVAQDPLGSSDEASITVFSQNVALAPTFTGISSISMSEDGSYEYDLSDKVSDGDNSINELSWTFDETEHLTVTFEQSTNTLTITPENNWYGSENISIKVEDPGNNVAFASLEVNVNSVNDVPSFTGDISAVTVYSGSFKTLDLKEYIVEPDGFEDIENIELLESNNQYIGYFIDKQNLEITFFSAPQYYGGQTYMLRVTDSQGAQPAPKPFLVTIQQRSMANSIQVAPFGGTSDIRLSWQTSTATMDYVEYGFDASYGMRTAVDDEYSKNHTALLTELSDATKYHFRIVSKDSYNYTLFSQDSTFETGLASDQINAFPIPFRRSQGGEGVFFTNLPENSEVQIYTLAGDIVFRELNISPFMIWNARNKSGKMVGSGLYLYVIRDNEKKKKIASGKLIVIN